MAEPATSGAATWIGSKLLPPLLGFIGASLMLLYTRELDPRRMVVAVGFGVVAAWLVPPIAVPALRSGAGLDWLPADGSVEGLLGLLIGLAAINLVGLWLKASGNPAEALAAIKGAAQPKE